MGRGCVGCGREAPFTGFGPAQCPGLRPRCCELRAVRRLRLAQELSQQALADQLHIDRSTWAYYETGKTWPDINGILAICTLLKTDFRTLFAGLEPPCHDGPDDGEPMMIYSLSKRERQLISSFRYLTPAQQEAALETLEAEGILLS